jgi:hypothetical protein
VLPSELGADFGCESREEKSYMYSKPISTSKSRAERKKKVADRNKDTRPRFVTCILKESTPESLMLEFAEAFGTRSRERRNHMVVPYNFGHASSEWSVGEKREIAARYYS